MFHIPGTDQVSVLWSRSFSCSRVCFRIRYIYTFVLPLHRLHVRQPPTSCSLSISIVFCTDPEVSLRFYKWQEYNLNTWRRRDIHAAVQRSFSI
ncbi:hypothetical protein CROQUDRAFT_659299, partial [Cronartium quercuum f. sp. fusiforme G11]